MLDDLHEEFFRVDQIVDAYSATITRQSMECVHLISDISRMLSMILLEQQCKWLGITAPLRFRSDDDCGWTLKNGWYADDVKRPPSIGDSLEIDQ